MTTPVAPQEPMTKEWLFEKWMLDDDMNCNFEVGGYRLGKEDVKFNFLFDLTALINQEVAKEVVRQRSCDKSLLDIIDDQKTEIFTLMFDRDKKIKEARLSLLDEVEGMLPEEQLAATFTHPQNGCKSDQTLALQNLHIGRTYAVLRKVVHDFSTEIYLHTELPDVSFNSVLFDLSDDSEYNDCLKQIREALATLRKKEEGGK